MDKAKRLQFIRDCQLTGWERGFYWSASEPTTFFWRFLGGRYFAYKKDFESAVGDSLRHLVFWDHPEFFAIRRDLRWEYTLHVAKTPWIAVFQPYRIDEAELDAVRSICNFCERELLVLPHWNWYGFETHFVMIAPAQWASRYAVQLGLQVEE